MDKHGENSSTENETPKGNPRLGFVIIALIAAYFVWKNYSHESTVAQPTPEKKSVEKDSVPEKVSTESGGLQPATDVEQKAFDLLSQFFRGKPHIYEAVNDKGKRYRVFDAEGRLLQGFVVTGLAKVDSDKSIEAFNGLIKDIPRDIRFLARIFRYEDGTLGFVSVAITKLSDQKERALLGVDASMYEGPDDIIKIVGLKERFQEVFGNSIRFDDRFLGRPNKAYLRIMFGNYKRNLDVWAKDTEGVEL